MHSLKLIGLLLVSVFNFPGEVSAKNQEDNIQADQGADSVVNVTAIRDPDWKPYSSMLKGVSRFAEKRDLAPTAELQFILVPRLPGVDMNALQLKLQSDEASLDIPLGQGNIFILPVKPELARDKAELMLNRKAGSVTWLPYVRSPTTSDTVRRLGDLRLACEVHWAIDKETLPFAARTSISALGGPCNFVSKKGTYSFSEPRRISRATISFNGKTESVPVNGYSFTPPLREQRWANDSVIELQFAEDPSPGS
ncbi:hypothetical protein [Pseudoduganella umbonata]|uniref:Uncharacterized protein n=1 Tax=Pseudoduganella umbonata TaxID=864828 RepID=A0A4P8HIX4_9BURK|nr:hypothetical protein [Pseudoduganella umbonata]MBB3219433.1 hypothetical protein [Pseudoduganella umbonata]QCP09523.1 hypothetical protein FCL38_03115 [Pseudoduganella umbonata]